MKACDITTEEMVDHITSYTAPSVNTTAATEPTTAQQPTNGDFTLPALPTFPSLQLGLVLTSVPQPSR